MDREIYKQRFMEADSSRMPVSEFQKIINDSIYPATDHKEDIIIC